MVKIVECKVSDIEQLSEISVSTFSETFSKDNSKENMKDFLENSYNVEVLRKEFTDVNSRFYFLVNDDIKIGYLKIKLEADMIKQNNILEIERIYLLKKYQDHGFGGSLMNYAQDTARALNRDGICLGVWENNFKAQRFYKKQGFKKIGAHDFNLGNSRQTDYILLKRLKDNFY
ncbi:GNAT family N-acetyltransferase [Companilactobacillus keshanensis]|uniref:GNAT family N-acetyltransferase n=1 Tax=Companilactobacillus keshanensis TaxID=2486003 RepID=A0ABW4BSV6_9LACO|nr:N-acetyltransferase [Companilactobacillus keshanensis]